ncbi:MAG: hypothetical protein PF480_07820 [Roseovarius sp.]|nr:hypothetical protein [Roseovarius sp.]
MSVSGIETSKGSRKQSAGPKHPAQHIQIAEAQADHVCGLECPVHEWLDGSEMDVD